MDPLSLNDLEQQSIDWLWTGRLARGMLTILQADPGMGKGLVTIDLAARITRGVPMPDSDLHPTPETLHPENVLLCTTEDARASAQRARAEAAGADLSRLFSLPPSEYQYTMDSQDAITYILEQLEIILSKKPYALVIIDPLTGFLEALAAAAEKDGRRALTMLTRIAERRNCAILAVLHLNKQTGRSAIHRGLGAVAFTAVARFVFCLGAAPASCQLPPDSRVLGCVKNNVSAHPPALAFRVVPSGEAARVEWCGEVELTADELLSRPRSPKRSAERIAAEWLAGLLANGPLPETRVRELSRQAGISVNSLRNAKAVLDVVSQKEGFAAGSGWIWSLPS